MRNPKYSSTSKPRVPAQWNPRSTANKLITWTSICIPKTSKKNSIHNSRTKIVMSRSERIWRNNPSKTWSQKEKTKDRWRQPSSHLCSTEWAGSWSTLLHMWRWSETQIKYPLTKIYRLSPIREVYNLG